MNFLNLSRTSRSPALYRVYVERIEQFRKQPPGAGWDGVYTHSTK